MPLNPEQRRAYDKKGRALKTKSLISFFRLYKIFEVHGDEIVSMLTDEQGLRMNEIDKTFEEAKKMFCKIYLRSEDDGKGLDEKITE